MRRCHLSSLSLLPASAAACIAAMTAISCGNSSDDTSEAEPIDKEVTPTMVTDSVNTFISDSGITRYHITADKWLMFEEAEEPNWKFPTGMYIERYDSAGATESTVVCDSAVYLSQKKIWELDRNVRMLNRNGDRFLTQQLFWDQNERKVYSDSFIHIERSDRIIEGYGFVSNEQMTDYTVKRPSGIFPVSDFVSDSTQQTEAADTIAAAADVTTQPSAPKARTAPAQPAADNTQMLKSSSDHL